jgi:malonyl-CoA/methylmalonyl-CoA synthetase
LTGVSDANVFSLFRSRFPEDRQREFLQTASGEVYRYADLEAQTARMAATLSGLGVAPGERVACQVDKSPQALFLYLACLRAGFIYLPLNTAYTESELAYFLEDAEPAAVVCRPETESVIRRLAVARGVRHVLTLAADGEGSLSEVARSAEATFRDERRVVDDIAAILYTSGTTGKPKGAMITHGNLASNGDALAGAWGFSGSDVLLHALPIFHIHGLFVAVHCVLLSGGRMIFLPRFDADAVVQELARATVMMGVPTYYTRLLDHPDFGQENCRQMRLFTCGSAPLLVQTFEEFEVRTGHRILERYGMTETGMNTSNPLHAERKPGTVGLPLPGVEVRIVDEAGSTVVSGQTGELLVRGPNVFKGYWRMPEKSAEEFTQDGFFHTGDIARIDAEGYVSIVGRAKDMVISGGFNVYPKEIEGLIDAMDGIIESAIVGLPHPDFGEGVTAIVVGETRGSLPEEAQIIERLRDELANFKVPKRVLFVDELPRNSMGKVQKALLRERYADLYQS